MSAKNETIDKLQKELEELREPLDRKVTCCTSGLARLASIRHV